MQKVVLSFGSNIEPREDFISKAFKHLKTAGFFIIAKSNIIETKPILLPDQQNIQMQSYLNCLATFQTTLGPFQILQTIKQIESKIGRIPRGKWMPREIDIDIILYNDIKLECSFLTIPHKELQNRPFFAELLNQINITNVY